MNKKLILLMFILLLQSCKENVPTQGQVQEELVDFLPLYVGNTWRYNFYHKSGNYEGYIETYGIDEWEITSRYDSSGLSVYLVTEISDYKYHSVDYQTGLDTIYPLGIDTAAFAFVEYPDSMIKVDKQFYQDYSFPRYHIKADSIYFYHAFDQTYYTLKPEKGITGMGWVYWTAGSFYGREDYSLIEE